MLHIFKNDARRLWWAITVVLAWRVLQVFRYPNLDTNMNSADELLQLLPGLWQACLVLLLMRGEPAVGERQFWITRPYSRKSLLGSKAVFVVAFLLVPRLATDAAVLVTQGFHPLEHLQSLAWGQASLAASILGVAALAALTRNLAQAIVAALVYTAAVNPQIIVDARQRIFNEPTGMFFVDSKVWVLALTSVVIIAFQYARRRTVLARAMALSGLTLAILPAYMTPPEYVIRLQQTVLGLRRACGTCEVRYDPEKRARTPEVFQSPKDFTLAIPIRLTGLARQPGVSLGRSYQMSLDVLGAHGEHWEDRIGFRKRPEDPKVILDDGDRGWVTLVLDGPFLRQIYGSRMTVRGEIALTLERKLPSVTIPLDGETHAVAGLGRCWLPNNPGMSFQMVCQSPEMPVSVAQAALLLSFNGSQPLREELDLAGGPRGQNLTPLHRVLTYFMVPRQFRTILATDVEVTPRERITCGIIKYELRDLYLEQFLVVPPGTKPYEPASPPSRQSPINRGKVR
jgi:hypothetical protein